MHRRTRIKICGLLDKTLLHQCIDVGVDAIGLMFYQKSKRAITLEKAKILLKDLPAFITLVPVFVDPTHDEVTQVTKALPVSLLQFHGDESPAFCESFSMPYMKAVRVNQTMDLEQVMEEYASATAILCDSDIKGHYGGSGDTFDWDLLPNQRKKTIVLAGGLNQDNVHIAIKHVRPYAVDVSGGVENEQGEKCIAKVEAFIHAVTEADKHYDV